MERQASSKSKYVSREVREKNESMKHYKGIYSTVEMKVYDIAGGVSMEEIHDLQKRIKNEKGIRTARADWRTKTGIILWFCKNWDNISKFIENYRVDPLNPPEVEEEKEVKVEVLDNTSDELFDDSIFFNNEQQSFELYGCWNELIDTIL